MTTVTIPKFMDTRAYTMKCQQEEQKKRQDAAVRIKDRKKKNSKTAMVLIAVFLAGGAVALIAEKCINYLIHLQLIGTL